MQHAATPQPDLIAAAHADPGPHLVQRPAWHAISPGRLATMIRNPIEAWPQEVYRAPMVRTRFLGRDIVFVCAPELIHRLLVEEADKLGREEFMMRALGPALGSGVLTSDGPRWRWQRRVAALPFRHDQVRSFVPAMLAAAEATRDRWAVLAPGSAIDLPAEMMLTTLDIITETMVSGRGGMDVARFGTAMSEYLAQASWKLVLTVLRLPRWTPHPGAATARRACAAVRGTMRSLIERRRAQAERPADLLGLLMQAADPVTGQGMCDEELIDNLLTFIAAGHETTALALCWIQHVLAGEPGIEARVLAEIAAATGGGPVTPDTIDRLGYTLQVVKEAMRLYPPAPLMVRELLADTELGGERLRRGTSITVPVFAVHRHEAVWASPARFDPDRFHPDKAQGRHRCAYMPFGAGPRTCIGMSFALAEIVAVLAVLLPAFALRPARLDPPAPVFRVTLRPEGGMPVVLQPRAPA